MSGKVLERDGGLSVDRNRFSVIDLEVNCVNVEQTRAAALEAQVE
jgi:hypothetical protein